MTDAAGALVRPLVDGDLDEADRIFRVAFGTFLGVPEPERFFGDVDMVRTRWRAHPGAALAAVRELTDAVYPGLDVSWEIESVLAQGLGDIVLIDDASGVQGVAICHVGAGTEAGSGACYVKFGAVRPGPGAERLFGLLIDACHALAGRGFRREFQGVAMHRPNKAGYSTSDSFVIDDWR